MSNSEISTKNELVSQSIFGGLDGMVSVLGVIIGLAAASKLKIVDAAIGLAVASSISMGVGEYLGDHKESVIKAITMGVATLAGTLIPILPFLFFNKTPAFIIASILVVVFGGIVGKIRKQGIKGYVVTYTLLSAAVISTIVIAILTGAGG